MSETNETSFRARGLLLAALFAAGSAAGCSGIVDCGEDGAKCAAMLNENGEACATAYRLAQSESKRKACEAAVKVVAAQKVVAAIPGLTAMLAQPETSSSDDKHRKAAAQALGDIGDGTAVDALMAAIDMEAGTSGDYKDKNANRTNEAIATALGEIGDKKATPKLLALIDRSRDNYVVLKAVRALGVLKDKAAIPALEKIALTHDNKFMRKNAVMALGDIADPAATDTLIRMMFVEFEGVSFYREASFALYQIGDSAADALLNTMAGKNEAVNAYFEKSGGLKETAIRAKCGFVLGDLRDPRGVDPLIAAFKDAVAKKDPVVLAFSAAPLGALGDRRAVPVLKSQMDTLDASLRDPIMRALNQLGDRSVVPDMIRAMSAEVFVAKCVADGLGSKEECAADKIALEGAQRAAADHASNLAGPEHLDAFKAAVEAERDAKMKAYFAERFARVEVAVECKEDAACWSMRLRDPSPLIREKAAWELGRLRDPSTLAALMNALADKKPQVRSAAIMAYWQFGTKSAVPKIEAQLQDEQASADFIKVNEDLRRLLVHLQRQA
ncbi:MAG: HEAT repeat domain-containing protein [Deltaproteobacteria bacterium]|nr:HEAT repeat domain-containing protein [Deltaproteobacteria bacterium]